MQNFLNWVHRKTYNAYCFLPLVCFWLVNSGIVAASAALVFTKFFNCADMVNKETQDVSVKEVVNSKCFEMYDKEFHLKRHVGMFSLNPGIVALVTIIYSYLAKDRVEKYSIQTGEGDKEIYGTEMWPDTRDGRKCLGHFSTFFIYVSHLFIRIISLLTLTFKVFCPTDIPEDFLCPWPPEMHGKWNFNDDLNWRYNITNIHCTNSISSNINRMTKTVSYVNVALVIVTVFEFCYLAWSTRSDRSFTTDVEFIRVYLLLVRKGKKKFKKKLLKKSGNEESVLLLRNLDVTKTSSRPFSVLFNVVIQEGKQLMDMDAHPRKFDRHENCQSHLKTINTATKLTNIADILKSKKGVQRNQYYPQIILVTGKPSIGKSKFNTILLCQSKVKDDKFWRDKMVFLVNKTSILKGMLRCSKNQHSDHFSLDKYEFIRSNPTSTVLVFDELDKQTVERQLSRENTQTGFTLTDNIDSNSTPTNIIQRFEMLVREMLLKGVKILIMSRPTAQHLFDNFKIDKTVEILGFSEDEIRACADHIFCQNKSNTGELNTGELIWNQIKGSPELLSLCHIPGICDLVCSTLKDSRGPIRITELLEKAVKYLLWNHYILKIDLEIERGSDYLTASIPDDHKAKLDEIKKVAKNVFDKGEFVFNRHSTDKEFGEIANSGFFYKYPGKKQYFCFLHVALQAFLVASYVVNNKEEFQRFLKTYLPCDGQICDNAKFVIQFVAGLLRKNVKERRSETNNEKSKPETSDGVKESIQKRYIVSIIYIIANLNKKQLLVQTHLL